MLKAVVLAVVFCVAAVSALPIHEQSFEAWMTHHAKEYVNIIETATRKAIWAANAELVAAHNAEADQGLHSFHLGMNSFADLTNDEFRNLYTSPTATQKTGSAFLPAENVALPEEVDWRKLGYVTPVKNQGQCGSCWAFSTVASLEGQHYKATQNLVSLSEQNLVDCSHKGNQGCNGGLMDTAFQYIKDNGGIDTEESYPYVGKNGQCHFSAADVGATVTGFTDLPKGDENAMKNAVATVGPIAVAIDASHYSFQLYSHGVYDEAKCSSRSLDHGVTVVGYGAENGSDYWLVKNSWGTGWGEKGYILMSRNKDNQCGITTSASYPLV